MLLLVLVLDENVPDGWKSFVCISLGSIHSGLAYLSPGMSEPLVILNLFLTPVGVSQSASGLAYSI